MFLRLVADSFTRRPKRKMLTLAALALGMAVATAALSVSLDVGDRLAQEFRSLGANLIVTPQADSLPLEIGGVDYRPANAGAYLPEADLGKLKTIFWRFNIMSFAPILDVPVDAQAVNKSAAEPLQAIGRTTLIGTWHDREVPIPDGNTYETGIEKTNPWWHVEGKWFQDDSTDCVVGTELAKRFGLKLGDVLNVAATDKSIGMAVTVVGILTKIGR